MIKSIVLNKCFNYAGFMEKVDDKAREKIIRAARELFAQKGLDGTSTREIASLSGTNVSLISYYFGGKEKLYETVIREFAIFARDFLVKPDQDYSKLKLTPELLKSELRGVAEKILDLRIKNPDIGIILERERIEGLPHSQEVYEKVFSSIGETFGGLIERGKHLGFVKPKINSRAFFMIFMESILGYATACSCKASFLEDTYHLPEDKDDFLDFIMLIFIEGIIK